MNTTTNKTKFFTWWIFTTHVLDSNTERYR